MVQSCNFLNSVFFRIGRLSFPMAPGTPCSPSHTAAYPVTISGQTVASVILIFYPFVFLTKGSTMSRPRTQTQLTFTGVVFLGEPLPFYILREVTGFSYVFLSSPPSGMEERQSSNKYPFWVISNPAELQPTRFLSSNNPRGKIAHVIANH